MDLLTFQEMFPDEAACERYLIEKRWPEGFVCPACGEKEGWYLSARRSFQCKSCHSQESITADTLFHRTRTSLREWFLAIHLVTESKKGVSIAELARQLGMKDEQRASRMKRRIQEAMAERNSRYLLQGFVELDEAVFVESGENVPVMVAVSVEDEGRPKYVRFQVVDNMKAPTLEAVAQQVLEASCDVATDGHPSHNGFSEIFNEHIACIQRTPADGKEYLPWVHILISNAKRFINGTHHSVNRLQSYLEEFTWRFNRRFCDLFQRMIISSIHYKPAYLP